MAPATTAQRPSRNLLVARPCSLRTKLNSFDTDACGTLPTSDSNKSNLLKSQRPIYIYGRCGCDHMCLIMAKLSSTRVANVRSISFGNTLTSLKKYFGHAFRFSLFFIVFHVFSKPLPGVIYTGSQCRSLLEGWISVPFSIFLIF